MDARHAEILCARPVHRKYHHNLLTFRGMYAQSENFVLSLSHDEVVHLKGSLLTKMGALQADDWQKRASLRLLFGYQYALPGKKLLFMGAELGQWREWNHEGVWTGSCSTRRNTWESSGFGGSEPRLFRRAGAFCAGLFRRRLCLAGCGRPRPQCAVVLRQGETPEETVLVVCNFAKVPWEGYLLGVPARVIGRNF